MRVLRTVLLYLGPRRNQGSEESAAWPVESGNREAALVGSRRQDVARRKRRRLSLKYLSDVCCQPVGPKTGGPPGL